MVAAAGSTHDRHLRWSALLGDILVIVVGGSLLRVAATSTWALLTQERLVCLRDLRALPALTTSTVVATICLAPWRPRLGNGVLRIWRERATGKPTLDRRKHELKLQCPFTGQMRLLTVDKLSLL